ncbi:MAG: Uncharacterized protein CEN90_397 [Parcubacteria group bacterium Licking1014_17]|nr:MAG: Uncharacterized protein CEN90_397 [Parcubacteria group bacterium Licking1014_17]
MALSIAVAVLIIGGAVFFSGRNDSDSTVFGNGGNVNNVSIVDGKQIIDISAKGGYRPRKTIAKANMPTIIRMNTQGTFDCSAALSIPSLNFRKVLSPTGMTEIEIPPRQAGSELKGICAMGMYSFTVDFSE